MIVNLQNGKIISTDWQRYVTALPDGQYMATIHKPRAKRSLNQNRYYWGVVIAHIVNYCGQDAEDVHEYLADLFLSENKDLKLNGVIRRVRTHPTTTKLSTTQFNEYIDSVRSWAAWELDLRIPSPKEANYEI